MIKVASLGLIFIFVFSLGAPSGHGAGDTLYLDLSACVSRALSEDLRLARQKLTLRSAQNDRFQSYMAFLPSVSARTGYSMNWGRFVDPTTNDFIAQTTRFLTFGGSADLPLFAGFQSWNRIRQARLDVAGARYGVMTSRQEVQLGILTLYLDVLLAEETLAQRFAAHHNARRALARGKLQWQAGALPAGDTLALRAELARREADIVTAENQRRIAKMRLKQSLRIPFETPVFVQMTDVDHLLKEMDPLTEEAFTSLYRQALGTQPSVKQAEMRQESAHLGLTLARARLYPTLNLSGGFRSNYSSFADRARFTIRPVRRTIPIGYLQSDPSEIVLSQLPMTEATQVSDDYNVRSQLRDNLNYFLGLGLTVPVFNRWTVQSQIQQAKIDKQRARLNVVFAQDALRQDMELAYQQARAAQKGYIVALKRLQATSEDLRATEANYLNGQTDYTNYQIKQNEYYQSDSEALRAKYSYIFRQKVLGFYKGEVVF